MTIPYPNSPVSTDIAEKYASYRKHVLPKNAPPVQVRECDLAFHAGALAVFELLTTNSPDDEAAAMRYMESLRNELSARADRYLETRT